MPVVNAVNSNIGAGALVAVASIVDAAPSDADGSETIDLYRLQAIDPALEFRLNGVPLVANPVTGFIEIAAADWPAVRVVGPAFAAGGPNDYTFSVSARASETNAENDVALQSAFSAVETVTLTVDDVDDGVTAANDTAVVLIGEATVIDVLANDSAIDGGATVTTVDGQTIASGETITIANGPAAGLVEVTLLADGTLAVRALSSAPDTFTFGYTVRDTDADGNHESDAATVAVTVAPYWRLSGDASVTEGADAAYRIELGGLVAYGETVSVDIARIDVDTSAGDVGDLDAAVAAAVASDTRYSYENGTLTYTGGYAASYEAGGYTFENIRTDGTGTAINSTNTRAIGPFDLGFEFDFFDKSFSEIWIDDDGRTYFGGELTADVLNAYGRGFDPRQGNGEIYVSSRGEPGARQYVIQYDRMQTGTNTNSATFQIVLNEADGTIEYRYQDIDLPGTGSDFGQGVNIDITSGSRTIGNPGTPGAMANGSRVVFSLDAGDLDLDLNATDDALGEGPEDFRLELSGAAGSTIERAAVETEIADDDPYAVDDEGLSIAEDATDPLLIAVLGNDGDPDGAGLSVTHIAGQTVVEGAAVTIVNGGVTQGTATLAANGVIEFAPAPDFNGPVQFSYAIADGSGNADTANVRLTVTPVADAPVATDDAFTMAEDAAPRVLDLLGNDTDADGDQLTVATIEGQAVNVRPERRRDGGWSTQSRRATLRWGRSPVDAAGAITFDPDPATTTAKCASPTRRATARRVRRPRSSGTDHARRRRPGGGGRRVHDGRGRRSARAGPSRQRHGRRRRPADGRHDRRAGRRCGARSRGHSRRQPGHGDEPCGRHGQRRRGRHRSASSPPSDYHGEVRFAYEASDGTARSSAQVVGTVTPVADAPVAADDAFTMAEDAGPLVLDLRRQRRGRRRRPADRRHDRRAGGNGRLERRSDGRRSARHRHQSRGRHGPGRRGGHDPRSSLPSTTTARCASPTRRATARRVRRPRSSAR